jgi:WD40 repeat protein
MQLYTGDRIKSYEIIEYLASGGYGSVYKAQDAENGQIVALKMLNPGAEQQRQRARFVREIETLCKLNHPNIVRLYQWETQNDPLWYTMELLSGPSLQKVMLEERPVYQKVGMLRQVAAAVAYLHDQGYIHRDIKPQNVMFRTPESDQCVLFDMGLVHDPCSNLTLGRQILGTPGYLSPEQMDGRYDYKQIDVWALGVILYQWLTKVHPFVGSGKSTIEVMHSIQDGAMIDPKKIDPLVDPYLAEICHQALEKNAEKRYPDGRAFENALGKWESVNYTSCMQKGQAELQEGRLDNAIAMFEKAYLWQPEEQVVKELKNVWEKKLGQPDIRLLPDQKVGESQQRAQEKGEALTVRVRRLVSDPTVNSNQHIYVVCVKNTRRLPTSHEIRESKIETTVRKPGKPIEPEVVQSVPAATTPGVKRPPSSHRLRLSFLLLILVAVAAFAAYPHFSEIMEMAHPWFDKIAKLWTTPATDKSQNPPDKPVPPVDHPPQIPETVDMAALIKQFELCKTWNGHTDWVHSLSISPDGKLLASGGADQTIRLWDIETGKESKRVSEHTGAVWSVSFSHDGNFLASGSADGTVKLWAMPQTTLLKTLSGHADIVFTVAFSHDDQWLLSGSGDRTIKFWDIENGKEKKSLSGHGKWILSLAFSPEGMLLASGSTDKSIKIWTMPGGELLRTLAGHTQDIYHVTFSNDGKWLLSTSEDKTVRLWDIKIGKEVKIFRAHTQAVFSAAFTPDNRFMASGGTDNIIRLWDIESGQEIHRLAGHSQWILALLFSRDGQTLFSAGADKTIRLWGKAAK